MFGTRREFVGTVLAAGVLGKTGEAWGRPGKVGPPSSPVFSGRPQSSTWDVSWTGRITGSHKAVFDSPEVSQGLALVRTQVWFRDYGEIYGTSQADMSAVVVLRHNGIFMCMDDTFWDHHKLGETTKINDPRTGKPIRRNPFLGPTPFSDIPPAVADEVLKKVLAQATVLACNLAFQDIVEMVKPEAGGDAERARSMALRHLVPGIVLQPSGVFAVLRAEEAGCNYFMAS